MMQPQILEWFDLCVRLAHYFKFDCKNAADGSKPRVDPEAIIRRRDGALGAAASRRRQR
jgi:hypothetical protein